MNLPSTPDFQEPLLAALTAKSSTTRAIARGIASEAFVALSDFVEKEQNNGTDDADVAIASISLFVQSAASLLLFRSATGRERDLATALSRLFTKEILDCADSLVEFRKAKAEARR